MNYGREGTHRSAGRSSCAPGTSRTRVLRPYNAMKRPESRFTLWSREDATRIIYDAFTKCPKDEILINHLMRLANAGFGARYRKGAAFRVAVIMAWVDVYAKNNPKIPRPVLCASLLRERGVTREQLASWMKD